MRSMWPLAAMARPGTVPLLLPLLLLTSVVAVQYHWLDTVSLPGPAVRSVSARSAFVCGLRCKALSPEQCSGFHYESGDGMCHLYSADCRGPAADSSQLPTVRYMARNTCPGSVSSRCECPSGFTRYGSRCLVQLSPGSFTTAQAASRCAALGAHLVVPRSEAENAQMAEAALPYHTGGPEMSWLGIEELSLKHWIGADGCGPITNFFWANTQPEAWNDEARGEFAVSYAPPNGNHYPGWHTQPHNNGPHWPLCQLPLCYRPDCQ